MKIRRFKHINEDNPQPTQPLQEQLPAQQPNQQQQQQQGGQLQGLNGIDYNACVANINKFVGTLYKNIHDTVKGNFEKGCPEIGAILKDQQSPLKDQVTQLNNAFLSFNKVEVKPEDAKTIATSIEEFAKFITALTTFNTQVTQQAELQQLQQGNLQQQGNNLNQLQPALPLQNNAAQPQLLQNNAALPLQQTNNVAPQQVNASYDTSHFSKVLAEKLVLKQYENSIRSRF